MSLAYADPALHDLLRELRLHHAARECERLAARAAAENWTHLEFLAALAKEEVARRDRTRVERMRRNARFPFLKTIEEFDFSNQPDRRLSSISNILAPDFVSDGRCLVLTGKPGSGKTHLAIGIAERAIQNGFEARYVTASSLLDELREGDAKNRRSKAFLRYAEPDILVIDELAGIAVDAVSGQRLLDLVHERHLRRRSMIVTTTKDLPDWSAAFGEPAKAAAIIDRLLERGRLIRLEISRAPQVDEHGIPLGFQGQPDDVVSQPYAGFTIEAVRIPEPAPLPSPPVALPPRQLRATPLPMLGAAMRSDSVFVEPEAVIAASRRLAPPPGRDALATPAEPGLVLPPSQVPTEVPPQRDQRPLAERHDSLSGVPEHEMDLGMQIDDYTITRLLGTGGIGNVYVGVDGETRGEVAIKILQRAQAHNVDIRTRFLLEAQIPRLVKHRNIIQIIATGLLPDERPFYVMELLDGQSLRDRLYVNTPLTVHDALRIFVDVADAMRAIHKRRIVHRDLKPENIFLTFYASGQVVAKIVDFGIARVPLKIAGVDIDSKPLLTVGTPRYMAPERLVGGEGDARTDIYALGLIMYETFTGGDWPWDVEMNDVVSQRQAHLDRRPQPSTRLAKIGPRLQKLVMRCLEKDPSRRPATADEIKDELIKLSTELPKRYSYSSDGGNVIEKLRRLIPRA
jgi:serine/threonine-protein kinase